MPEGDQVEVMDEERKAWDEVSSALLGQAESRKIPGGDVVGDA